MWGKLFGGIVGALVIFFATDSIVATQCDHQNGQTNQAEHRDCTPVRVVVFEFIGDWIERNEHPITVLATVAIGLFTYTLWRSTAGLQRLADQQATDMRASLEIASQSAKATTKAAKVAEDSLVAGERAFVYFDFEKAAAAVQSGEPIVSWMVSVYLRNSGKTPAVRVISVVDWKFVFEGDPQVFEVPEKYDLVRAIVDYAPSFVAPGGIKKIADTGFPAHEAWKSTVTKDSRFYVWGWVEYDDVFSPNERRRTEFCYYLRVKGFGGNPDPRMLDLLSHTHHNGMDKDCYYQARSLEYRLEEQRQRKAEVEAAGIKPPEWPAG